MKIYIAGPMSGFPEFNYPTFHAVASALELTGERSESVLIDWLCVNHWR